MWEWWVLARIPALALSPVFFIFSDTCVLTTHHNSLVLCKMFFRFSFYPNHLLLSCDQWEDPLQEAGQLHENHQQPVSPGSCDVSGPCPGTHSQKFYLSFLCVQMSQINETPKPKAPSLHRQTEPTRRKIYTLRAPFLGAWSDHPSSFSQGSGGLPLGQ